MKKLCNQCKIEKDLSEFHTRNKIKNTYQSICKNCRKILDNVIYVKNIDVLRKNKIDRKAKIKIWFNDYKSKLRCSRCQENHIACLVFHHKNPQDKDINVSDAIRCGWSIKHILQEIDKCSILCANCHAKFHWEEKQGLAHSVER
jgi:hypothetical protein